MFYLFNHLEYGSFRTVYADTDSMCLALTKTLPESPDCTEEQKYRNLFDPIVRPEMRESWESTWKDWFVTTTEPEDLRRPGKLKCEFLFRKGAFVALSPKTYFAFNSDENAIEKVKSGYKGVCHVEAQKLTLDTYLRSLYGNEEFKVTNRGFRLNKQKQMTYYQQHKKGLNNIFCKFHVQDDRITCKPLCKNNKIL